MKKPRIKFRTSPTMSHVKRIIAWSPKHEIWEVIGELWSSVSRYAGKRWDVILWCGKRADKVKWCSVRDIIVRMMKDEARETPWFCERYFGKES